MGNCSLFFAISFLNLLASKCIQLLISTFSKTVVGVCWLFIRHGMNTLIPLHIGGVSEQL